MNYLKDFTVGTQFGSVLPRELTRRDVTLVCKGKTFNDVHVGTHVCHFQCAWWITSTMRSLYGHLNTDTQIYNDIYTLRCVVKSVCRTI